MKPFESFNPILGGEDIGNDPLYICRVYHHGSLLIGKLKVNPHENICWVAEGSKEFLFRKNFEVLTNPENAKFGWRRLENNMLPNNTVIGGRTSNRRPIYIGRCKLTRSIYTTTIPGSVFTGNSLMKVPFGHSAIDCTPYELLVCEE